MALFAGNEIIDFRIQQINILIAVLGQPLFHRSDLVRELGNLSITTLICQCTDGIFLHGIHQNGIILGQTDHVGRGVAGVGKVLGLHIIQSDVAAGYPQEVPSHVINGRDDADHHNGVPLQLIDIGFHNVSLAGGFDFSIVFLLEVVEGVLMFFKHIAVF